MRFWCQNARGGRRGGAAEGEHDAGHAAFGQRGHRAAGHVGAHDHHRGQRVAEGGLHRLLPPGVDLQQLAQRAHDAVELGEVFGAAGTAAALDREREPVGA